MTNFNELQKIIDEAENGLESAQPSKMGAGWRISAPYSEQKDSEYMRETVQELLARPRPPKPVIPSHFNGKLIADLSSSERDDFYFSMQPKSTQEALTRQKTRKESEDREWALRPMADCIAVPEATTKEALVGERALSAQDVILVEGLRRSQKNTIGQSDKGSVDPEKRQKAIEAFTYSRPAELTDAELKKVTKLTEVKSEQLEPQKPKKRGFWSRLFGPEEVSEVKAPARRLKWGRNSVSIVTEKSNEN